ncbi:Ubiquitin carboxyl-terminal hydrolase MINDY-1 isoform 1 [Schistosoma japonicum]|uniref:Ubiquitin carboxyl-terminal hydrolase n=1 Tax=Schistosoma japonicum TaxID=6182 RepID=A0A4Z2DGL8_SCHJA|nr:Ubiquitin carboxyl-terminal hydrolase MINDY-1 isoform 1 [Schistosoma japonicum]
MILIHSGYVIYIFLCKNALSFSTDSLKCITEHENISSNSFIKGEPGADSSAGFSNLILNDENNLKSPNSTHEMLLSTSLPNLFESSLNLNSTSQSLPILCHFNNHSVQVENECSVHTDDGYCENIPAQPDNNSVKNDHLIEPDSNEYSDLHLNTKKLMNNVCTPMEYNDQSSSIRRVESSKLLIKPPNTLFNTDSPVAESENFIYHIKWIKFNNQTRPIITQNNNGPCPMIAIANVLLLRGTINLSNDSELISGNRLLAMLSELLLSKTPDDLDYGQRINYESNFRDALCLFPCLQTGLDINIRFTGVADFEYTSTLSLFDLFNIHIYHGWLVDPDEHDLVAAVGNKTYNQLAEELLRLGSSDNSEDLYRSALVEWFLNQSGSQLTFHGLSQLVTTLRDEELAVFFRNNHFSTILKHKDCIFVLVTDMGLLNEPNIVWELLNDLDGDTQFVDCSFQLFCPTTSVVPSNTSITKTSDAVRIITIKSDKLNSSKCTSECKTTIANTTNSNKSKDNFIEEKYYLDSFPDCNFTDTNSTSLDYDLCKMLQEEEIRASNQDPETFWKLYK